MKIRDRYTGRIGQPGPIRGREKTGGAGKNAPGARSMDRVQISGRSVEIQNARLLALQAPDIRQELVDDIVGQLKHGEYHVTGGDVVPRMIREHLADGVE
jgi:hypothetical protein